MTTMLARLVSTTTTTRTLVAGILLMCVIVFAAPAYGLATSSARLDPALREAAASGEGVNVVIDLGFAPESFHMRQLQARGTIGLVRDTRVELHRVSPANLEELSRTPWITRVTLLK